VSRGVANVGGFRGSVHHLNVRVVCLAARRVKVVATMRRFGLCEREQERVWELWGDGTSLRAVARRLGARPEYVRRYVTSTGGVKPAPRKRSERCLSRVEREEISRGLARGDSFRSIGAAIGRGHTTVLREVDRNGGRERYRGHDADEAAWGRARRPKRSKLAVNSRLRGVVEDKLGLDWSPEQISAWLRRNYCDDLVMQVSHETIYLSLFVQSRGALRHELCAQLRGGRRTRRPRRNRQGTQGQGKIREMVMISERPAEIEDRAVPGHWEGDLLLGKRPTGIATLVERTSRYTQLVALPDGYRAEPVCFALAQSICELPSQLCRSLTWDQGKEMAEHVRFTVESGVRVYFCDPNSPWQRGTNENTNGLLRQYFPQRSDLGRITQEQLDAVAAQLNGRPRKTLGWMTPAERFAQLAHDASAAA
jgi:IS30 family transposase